MQCCIVVTNSDVLLVTDYTVFLYDKFGKIALSDFITVNDNQGIAVPKLSESIR